MKDDVGYEEFLAAVYEAENEGMEGKALNMKAKAMTVEKVIEEREKSELKDLKQQTESLTMIMKSTTIGTVKAKGREGIPSPRNKVIGEFTTEKNARITQKGKNILETRPKTSSVF